MPKISGRIIRILDPQTVIINLGKRDGIVLSSVFSILAEPEAVVDPVTNEALGLVRVVKATVRAMNVEERFTIASSKWTTLRGVSSLAYSALPAMGLEMAPVDGGDLRVSPDQLQPWRALSQEPVRVGDEVVVEIWEPIAKSTEDSDDGGGDAGETAE